jgi:hypothetical protein
MLEKVFDYTVDDWQTFGMYCYFAMLAGVLLAVVLFMIVVAI